MRRRRSTLGSTATAAVAGEGGDRGDRRRNHGAGHRLPARRAGLHRRGGAGGPPPGLGRLRPQRRGGAPAVVDRAEHPVDAGVAGDLPRLRPGAGGQHLDAPGRLPVPGPEHTPSWIG
jgi:hypothetical protein